MIECREQVDPFGGGISCADFGAACARQAKARRRHIGGNAFAESFASKQSANPKEWDIATADRAAAGPADRLTLSRSGNPIPCASRRGRDGFPRSGKRR